MPYVGAQAVAHHGAQRVLVVVFLLGRVQQVAAQFPDVDKAGRPVFAYLTEEITAGKLAPYKHAGTCAESRAHAQE